MANDRAARMDALMDHQPRGGDDQVYNSSSSGFYTDDSIAWSGGRRSSRRPHQARARAHTTNVHDPEYDLNLPQFPPGFTSDTPAAIPYREGSDSDRRDAARVCNAFNMPVDESGDSADSPAPLHQHERTQPTQPKSKKRKTSPYFQEADPHRDDDVFEGDGPPIIDVFDEEDRFKKMIQYRPVHSKNIKFLCGETLNPDPDEKRRVDAMLESVRPVGGAGAGMGRTTIPPLFTTLENRTHEHRVVSENECFLCVISEANVPDFIADRQSAGTRDVRYSAYAQMMFNDLKRCGTVKEPQLMQENTDIFNQEMARLAAAGKANCQSTTVSVMNHHLELHDRTNPKRPVLKAMLKAKYIADQHFDAIEGITTDGTNARVLRQTYTKLYFAAEDKYLSYCNKFAAVCSYVNIYMLGETPLTGKPLHAIMGGTAGKTGGGEGASRHMALKKLAGNKMLGFLS